MSGLSASGRVDETMQLWRGSEVHCVDDSAKPLALEARERAVYLLVKSSPLSLTLNLLRAISYLKTQQSF